MYAKKFSSLLFAVLLIVSTAKTVNGSTQDTMTISAKLLGVGVYMQIIFMMADEG